MAGAKSKEPVQMADSGLDTLTHDKNPWKDLMCVAASGTQAHKLSDRPMMLHCGHRMCYVCFQSHTQDTDKTGHMNCISGDTDCEPSIIKEVRPDIYASKEIKGLRYGTADNTCEARTVVDKSVVTKEAIRGRRVGSQQQSGKKTAALRQSLSKVIHQEQIQADLLAELQKKLKIQQGEVDEYKRKVEKMRLDHNKLRECVQNQEEIIQQLERDSAAHAAKIEILESRENAWATREELDQQKSDLDELCMRFAGTENGMNTLRPASGVAANMFPHMPLNDDGRFIWKIPNYHQKKTQAQERKVMSLTSDPFATPRPGYMMCARAYINGDGRGIVGKYLSLYVEILRGEYDELMQWPFNQKMTFTIKAQKVNGDKSKDFSKIVTFDKSLPCCLRPGENPNPAFGLQKFVKISDIESSKCTYLCDDTIYFEITVL